MDPPKNPEARIEYYERKIVRLEKKAEQLRKEAAWYENRADTFRAELTKARTCQQES